MRITINTATPETFGSGCGNLLERLAGVRRGKYSIRINEQWRICFDWKAGRAANVEIVDYH